MKWVNNKKEMNMRTDVDVYIYERLISYLSKIAKEQNLAEEVAKKFFSMHKDGKKLAEAHIKMIIDEMHPVMPQYKFDEEPY